MPHAKERLLFLEQQRKSWFFFPLSLLASRATCFHIGVGRKQGGGMGGQFLGICRLPGLINAEGRRGKWAFFLLSGGGVFKKQKLTPPLSRVFIFSDLQKPFFHLSAKQKKKKRSNPFPSPSHLHLIRFFFFFFGALLLLIE